MSIIVDKISPEGPRLQYRFIQIFTVTQNRLYRPRLQHLNLNSHRCPNLFIDPFIANKIKNFLRLRRAFSMCNACATDHIFWCKPTNTHPKFLSMCQKNLSFYRDLSCQRKIANNNIGAGAKMQYRIIQIPPQAVSKRYC